LIGCHECDHREEDEGNRLRQYLQRQLRLHLRSQGVGAFLVQVAFLPGDGGGGDVELGGHVFEARLAGGGRRRRGDGEGAVGGTRQRWCLRQGEKEGMVVRKRRD